MAELRLIVESGQLLGERFLVKEGSSVTIGRSTRCDVRVPDQGVSRQHCRLVNQSSSARIIDLDSSNGTFINEQPVHTLRLNDGDILTIGEAVLRVSAPGLRKNGSSGSIPAVTEGQVTVVEKPGGPEPLVRKKYARPSTVMATVAGISRDSRELEKVSQRLEALATMANTLNSVSDLNAILSTAAETILSVSGAERTAILMLDELTGELRPVVMRQMREGASAEADEDFHVSSTVVEETLRQGVSIISADAGQDDRFNAGVSIMMEKVRAVMCVPLRTDENIIGVIYVDSSSSAVLFSEEELSTLAAIGHQAGVAVERARLISDLENLFVGAMHTVIASLEAKDAYTRGHSERVTAFALMIADELNLDDGEREIIELSGLLHDVGKIGVPEAVLLKPGALTDEEFAQIQKHPVLGAKIIQNMPEIDRIVSMTSVCQAVRHHHERWDGKGYPAGLAAEKIPPAARILAIADTFDAITSDRPYRKGRGGASAIGVITECAGTQFDPTLAEVFQRIYQRGETETPEAVAARFRFGSSEGLLPPDVKAIEPKTVDQFVPVRPRTPSGEVGADESAGEEPEEVAVRPAPGRTAQRQTS